MQTATIVEIKGFCTNVSISFQVVLTKMSSKQIVFEGKMQFLNKIRENKHILIGAFSVKLRKQDTRPKTY